MATMRENESTSMILKVTVGGTTAKPTYANRTLNYIAPTTTDDNVRIFGNRIATLQTNPLAEVVRRDTATLVEE